MKKIVFMLMSLPLLVMICSCTSSYYLYTSSVSKNEILIDRGDEYQVAESNSVGLTFMVTGLDTDNGDNRIIFAIMNNSDSTYTFRDSQISIYGGNAEKNEWKHIQNWDAAAFYNKVKREAEEELLASRIVGALSVLNASMGSKSQSTVVTPYGNAVISTRSYNPADIALTAMASSIYTKNLAEVNKSNLAYLKDNLLYSSQITSGETYSGIIYFPGDRKYADYKVVFEDSMGKEEFLFAKSIRKEILHPWTTDTSRDLHAVTFNYSPFSDRIGINYCYLPPKLIGLYSGLSFYNFRIPNRNTVDGYYYKSTGSGVADNFSFKFDPDPSDSYTYSFYYDGRFTEKEEFFKSIAVPIGLTIKIASHSWLLTGVTIAYDLGSGYHIGKLEYSANGGPYKLYNENAIVTRQSSFIGGIEAQLGANFVFNFIDLGVITSYDFFQKRFAVDFCAGIAF